VLQNVRAPGRELERATVAKAIDNARAQLGDSGRLIVRPSGTEPVIRVMGEGDDRELVESLVAGICSVLKESAEAA
jgi:phosphoglucosamine mutase